MAKGFKDSSGKFHPTGNNGTSSREKSTQAEGFHHKRMKRIREDFEQEKKAEQEIKQFRKEHGLPTKTPAITQSKVHEIEEDKKKSDATMKLLIAFEKNKGKFP